MPYATTNSIQTYYEIDDGPSGATGTPLVLIHGFTGSLSQQWAEARPLLAADHRVIAYDLRGHGQSEAPEDLAAYTIAAYTNDLRDLLTALDVPRAHILGSSFGGMVALELALRYPDRIETLILSDTSAGPRCIELSEAIAAREDGIERALGYARSHGMDAYLERLLAMDPALQSDPYRLERFHEQWRQMTLHGFLGAGKARNERVDHHTDLERLTMPVLIIAGDRDPLVAAAEYMHAHIPHSALRLINHAGHPAVAEQPRGFVAVVRGFLSSLSQEPRPAPAGASGP